MTDEVGVTRPTPLYAKAKSGGAITVLSAAMIAVGEVLEPERAIVELVEAADDSLVDDRFDLDFGDLDPLE